MLSSAKREKIKCDLAEHHDEESLDSDWTQDIYTHVLELFVSTIVRDLLAQVYQDVVARVIRWAQQLLHLPPPFFVSHLVIL